MPTPTTDAGKPGHLGLVRTLIFWEHGPKTVNAIGEKRKGKERYIHFTADSQKARTYQLLCYVLENIKGKINANTSVQDSFNLQPTPIVWQVLTGTMAQKDSEPRRKQICNWLLISAMGTVWNKLSPGMFFNLNMQAGYLGSWETSSDVAAGWSLKVFLSGSQLLPWFWFNEHVVESTSKIISPDPSFSWPSNFV